MTTHDAETPPGTDADYAAIEAAVMETARGRWFLAEYARRNRSSDTRQVLTALERLETALAEQRHRPAASSSVQAADAPAVPRRLAAVIEDARTRISDIANASAGRLRNEEGLAIALSCAEDALTRTRAGVEGARAMAQMVREAGQPDEFCAAVDGHAQDVAAAEAVQETALAILAVLVDTLHRVESDLALPDDSAPAASAGSAPQTEPAGPGGASSPPPPASPSPVAMASDFDALSAEDRQALFS